MYIYIYTQIVPSVVVTLLPSRSCDLSALCTSIGQKKKAEGKGGKELLE